MWWLILAEQMLADPWGPLADEMAALVRFAADLDARRPGIGDGMLDMSRRVREVLDAVPLAELEVAIRDVHALVERLGDLERTIVAVRKLKMLLGA